MKQEKVSCLNICYWYYKVLKINKANLTPLYHNVSSACEEPGMIWHTLLFPTGNKHYFIIKPVVYRRKTMQKHYWTPAGKKWRTKSYRMTGAHSCYYSHQKHCKWQTQSSWKQYKLLQGLLPPEEDTVIAGNLH